jgi:hypothetical protein
LKENIFTNSILCNALDTTGIYTDIDNAPGPLFQNGTIILNDMDSFFEVDGMGGFPSQYFFAGKTFG